jgi:hypothetical protein
VHISCTYISLVHEDQVGHTLLRQLPKVLKIGRKLYLSMGRQHPENM